MSFLYDLVLLVLVAVIVVSLVSYWKQRKTKNKSNSDEDKSTATQVLELEDARPVANPQNGRQPLDQVLTPPRSHAIDHGFVHDDSAAYLDDAFAHDMGANEPEPADTMSYAELQLIQSPSLNGGEGNFHQLNTFPYVIGRTQGDLVINDKRISGKHATITLSDGRYYIIDTDSKNGVYLDGQRIESLIPTPLPMGQMVKISLGSATHLTFIGH